MLKYIKRGLVVGMLALAVLVIAYLLGVKTYGGSKKGTTQLYQPYNSSSRTTPASRLSSFKYTLTTLQQFGGGEVIFEGGEGFVRFRVRKDGSLVAMVPLLASVLHITSQNHVCPYSPMRKSDTIPSG